MRSHSNYATLTNLSKYYSHVAEQNLIRYFHGLKIQPDAMTVSPTHLCLKRPSINHTKRLGRLSNEEPQWLWDEKRKNHIKTPEEKMKRKKKEENC